MELTVFLLLGFSQKIPGLLTCKILLTLCEQRRIKRPSLLSQRNPIKIAGFNPRK